MQTSSHLLQIDDLHFGYASGAQVFQGWSARLTPGLTVLCGDESCGKTTLLRLLAGDLKGRGNIRLGGAPSAAGQVFWQDPRAQPDATPAIDYLQAQARRWPAWNEAEAQAHIDGLSLREHLGKPLLALSTGSRRKLWLTAALASGAELTLIDEPLSGLDTPSIRYLVGALTQAATPSRWLLVAHWEPLPGVPEDRVLMLPPS